MFFKRDVLLAQEYLAFMLLNLFDLFLTGWIFRNNGSEANGLAVFILDHFHLIGFVIYKFFLVVIVVLACEGISVQSIRKSRIVITAGCLVYLFIVFWECFLIVTYINGPKHQDIEGDQAAALYAAQPSIPLHSHNPYHRPTNTLVLRRTPAMPVAHAVASDN
jgi:hypothetical protein